MDPNQETPQEDEYEKLVLCSMPTDWACLPVYPAHMAPPVSNTISVYSPGRRRSVVYRGYICPVSTATVSQTQIQMISPRPRPSTRTSCRIKHRLSQQDREFEERPATSEGRATNRQRPPLVPQPDIRSPNVQDGSQVQTGSQPAERTSPAPPPPPPLPPPPPPPPLPPPPPPPPLLTPCTPHITYPLPEEILEREVSFLNLTCVDGVWCPADVQNPPAPVD